MPKGNRRKCTKCEEVKDGRAFRFGAPVCRACNKAGTPAAALPVGKAEKPSSLFDAVIAELEDRRDAIDAVIAAMRSLKAA